MKKFVLLIAVLAYCLQATAQVGINTGNLPPDPSAILDVNSATRGSLLPRMTHTQIEAISSPANGLQVFCTTDSKIYIFVSAVNLWKEIAYGTGLWITPNTGATNKSMFTAIPAGYGD
ncbi:MAG: hypothetical protein NTW16_00940 [Bacteroidetes bacterium]|nr:hypothetical protein [Bacteroidota bacterium]